MPKTRNKGHEGGSCSTIPTNVSMYGMRSLIQAAIRALLKAPPGPIRGGGLVIFGRAAADSDLIRCRVAFRLRSGACALVRCCRPATFVGRLQRWEPDFSHFWTFAGAFGCLFGTFCHVGRVCGWLFS